MYQVGSGRDYFNAANNIYNGLVQACAQLDIVIETPYWAELNSEANLEEVESFI